MTAAGYVDPSFSTSALHPPARALGGCRVFGTICTQYHRGNKNDKNQHPFEPRWVLRRERPRPPAATRAPALACPLLSNTMERRARACTGSAVCALEQDLRWLAPEAPPTLLPLLRLLRRWFSVAERKRAQSMPDSFQLVGSLEAQSKQVGESAVAELG